MDEQKAHKYIEDSGLLAEFTEEKVKVFFEDNFEKYQKGEFSKDEFSDLMSTLLYDHLYDSELKIKESALLSAMEMATELAEVEKDSADYKLVIEPIQEYLQKSA